MIDQKIINAVEALKKRGAQVTIATGRAFELSKPFADHLGITQPMIVNNGALIKSHHDNTIYYSTRLSAEVIKDFYQLAKKHQFAYTLHTETGFYINAIKSTAYYEEWNRLYPHSKVPYKIVDDALTLMHIDAYKFLLIIDDEMVFEAMRKTYHDRTDCTITKSHTSLFDITPPNTTKGDALKRLVEHADHPINHVIAFGDNDNDVDMLKTADIGFAMANATAPCKAAADYVCEGTSDSDGIYQILAQFLAA